MISEKKFIKTKLKKQSNSFNKKYRQKLSKKDMRLA